MFAGEGMAGKLVPFKSEIGRGQGQHVPVGVKSKTGKFGESWLMRDVEAGQKKKAYICFRHLGSSKSLHKSKKCRGHKAVRNAERENEMVRGGKKNENLKRFHKYIQSK